MKLGINLHSGIIHGNGTYPYKDPFMGEMREWRALGTVSRTQALGLLGLTDEKGPNGIKRAQMLGKAFVIISVNSEGVTAIYNKDGVFTLIRCIDHDLALALSKVDTFSGGPAFNDVFSLDNSQCFNNGTYYLNDEPLFDVEHHWDTNEVAPVAHKLRMGSAMRLAEREATGLCRDGWEYSVINSDDGKTVRKFRIINREGQYTSDQIIIRRA